MYFIENDENVLSKSCKSIYVTFGTILGIVENGREKMLVIVIVFYSPLYNLSVAIDVEVNREMLYNLSISLLNLSTI